MVIESCDLTTHDGKMICDEFYYAVVKSETELKEWLNGLKLVYTLDDSDELDFDYAVAYMDDDQELMVETIVRLLATVNPSLVLNNIYVNYIVNSDGSKNLIKVVCVSFILPNGEFLVCKAPFYAFDLENTKKFLEEARKADKAE